WGGTLGDVVRLQRPENLGRGRRAGLRGRHTDGWGHVRAQEQHDLAGDRRSAEVDVGLLYRGREILVRQLVVDFCAAAFEFDNLCRTLSARVSINGQRSLFVPGDVSP